MTRWTISLSSLRYYWRTQLSVLLGLAVSTAVLVGALVVGDSVRYTLNKIALDRIGDTHVAVTAPERFFTESLADRMGAVMGTACAPVLTLPGTVATPDGGARANRVSVYGVDQRFWSLGGSPVAGVGINQHLAHRLNVKEGDTVIVRVARPTALPGDAPLGEEDSETVALRLRVSTVIPDADLGRFSLQANQQASLNIFIPLVDLQERLDLEDRANLLLLGQEVEEARALEALRGQWQLEDAQLTLRPVPGQPVLELRSARVFIAPAVVQAVQAVAPDARPVLTYLVNRIQAGDNAAPYAMVTAMDRPEFGENPDAIILNNWTAEDLDVKPGEKIHLRYFVVGDKRALEEASADFNICTIVPIKDWAADPALMPDFPGLSEADNCRDWDPGFELELDAIREIDEAYWDMYRGTPKAFIPLATGQRIWQNRFGNVTALRFSNDLHPLEKLRTALRDGIDPLRLGVQVLPVREQALKASREAMSFGELFLSFSFFLIVAALLLAGLLFVFGVEQRAREIGTLLTLGYFPRTVRRLFLREGIILALLGSLLGVGLGSFYTRSLLKGLTTIWDGAIGNTALVYHATPTSLAAGGLAGLLIAILVISFVMRKHCRQPVQQLLTGSILQSSLEGEASAEPETGAAQQKLRPPFHTNKSGMLSIMALLGAGISLIVSLDSTKGFNTAGFFIGGSILLLASLLGMHALLSRLLVPKVSALSISRLAWKNLTRRKGRSLATIAILACGSFMVVAVGANRLDALQNADRKDSGTGGFGLVAESVHPVLRDLNQPSVQEQYGLDPSLYAKAHIRAIRLKAGDDASCLNLNRAQQPRLLGITPDDFSGRFSFASLADGFEAGNAWSRLAKPLKNGTLPAIADSNSILWAMGKKLGDRLTFTDEQGQHFDVQLIGGLANSMLQGSVLVDEKLLIEKYPSLGGYHQFLIDAPAGDRSAIAEDLSRALRDFGLEVQPAAQRLAGFNAVQNTYLSVFLILGGLGMILGTVGLGIVVLRNVLERRQELALLRALGFSRQKITRLIIQEHSLLLIAGVACGVVSALLAVLPALISPGATIPYATLGLIVAGILCSGFLWTVLAAKLSLRGELLEALRSE